METNKITGATFLLIVLAWTASAFVGCATTQNVSGGHPSFVSSYAMNQLYTTKLGLFVFRIGTGKKTTMRLEIPGRNQDGPRSVQDYQRLGNEKWPEIAGVLAMKTNLRISRIDLVTNYSVGNAFYVYGEIMDGPFRGQEVDITFISKENVHGQPPALVPTLNSALLELIETH